VYIKNPKKGKVMNNKEKIINEIGLLASMLEGVILPAQLQRDFDELKIFGSICRRIQQLEEELFKA
jgi:hypothetical protein